MSVYGFIKRIRMRGLRTHKPVARARFFWATACKSAKMAWRSVSFRSLPDLRHPVPCIGILCHSGDVATSAVTRRRPSVWKPYDPRLAEGLPPGHTDDGADRGGTALRARPPQTFRQGRALTSPRSRAVGLIYVRNPSAFKDSATPSYRGFMSAKRCACVGM